MPPTSQHTATRFDPFTDRRSRDIRNGLSQAFVDALAAKDAHGYHRAARKWLENGLTAVYKTYIRGRVERYDRIMAAGQVQPDLKPYATAIMIWNQGLFFEFHEYMETIWQQTGGDENRALKGLIKAAGVYVHLENRNLPAARRLAPKARRQMQDHAHCLVFIANLETLLACLKRPELPAPKLEFTQ